MQKTFRAVTRRALLGRPCRFGRQDRSARSESLVEVEGIAMSKALNMIHDIFVNFASESPRFLLLNNATQQEKNLQLDAYRMGSKSAKAVARRCPQIESFFLILFLFGAAPWLRGGSATASDEAAAGQAAFLLSLCRAQAPLSTMHGVLM